MPLIYNYSEPSVSAIAATNGSTVVDIATPNGATGNFKMYAPDNDVPGGVIQVEDSASDTPLILLSRGAGGFTFANENIFSGGESILELGSEDATPVNGLQITATNAGNAVRIQTRSQSETNIDLEIGGSGTGKTRFSTPAQYKDDSNNYWIGYPKVVPLTFNFGSTFSTTCLGVMPFNGVILYVTERHETAGTAGGNVNLQITVDDSGSALGTGSACLSNNSGNGFNLKATAQTTQNGTFSATPGPQFSAGQAITAKFSGTTTSLANVSVTVFVAYYG